MTRSRSRRLRWLRVGEIVFFTAGVCALLWVGLTHLRASQDQAEWAEELEQALLESRSGESTVAAVPHPGGASASPAPAERGPRQERERAPAKAQAGPGLIGRLEIPRVGLSAIAREGTDAATLRRAVGHIATTARPGEMGNAAFAGHRDTFFRQLRGVRPGDDVIVTTPQGRHRYVVTRTHVVQPRDVWVLESTGKAVLTLVTCYPFTFVGAAPERFIVRAELRPTAGAPAGD